MTLLVFAIVVVILVALLVWAVDYLPLPAPFAGIVKCLLIVLGVVVIANRAGVL